MPINAYAAKWILLVNSLKGKYWTGTRLSGYAEDGPYHCEDCRHLEGRLTNKVVRDSRGRGYCQHSIVIADPQVAKDSHGPLVNIEKGCCEFVDTKGIKGQKNPLLKEN